MTDANEELRRLKEAERSAHDRFKRLSGSDGIYGHPEIARAAKRGCVRCGSGLRAAMMAGAIVSIRTDNPMDREHSRT